MVAHPTTVEIRLKEQIRSLEQERDAIDIVIAKMKTILEGLSAPGTPNGLPDESLRQKIIQNMEAILQEQGPMHREAIKAALEGRGVYVPTIQTVANYLSRDARFINKGKGVWALVDDGPLPRRFILPDTPNYKAYNDETKRLEGEVSLPASS